MKTDGDGVALVLEGGGFRGLFTAGVLDVLMEHGIYGFTSVWGTSAGAMCATSFKSHQIGRTMRIMLAFRDDPRVMSVRSLARTGDVVDGVFMYDEIQSNIDPCDTKTFNDSPMRMFAVATDVVFGSSAYLECRQLPQDVDFVRASASMPLVSQIVELNGRRLLDGGTADSIPFEAALGISKVPELEDYVPARKALVVLTQDRSFKKELSNEGVVLRSHRYDAYPYFCEALESRHTRYNAKRERLFEMEAQEDPNVLVIAPTDPVEVGVRGASGEQLLKLYLAGRQQAELHLCEIESFFA